MAIIELLLCFSVLHQANTKQWLSGCNTHQTVRRTGLNHESAIYIYMYIYMYICRSKKNIILGSPQQQRTGGIQSRSRSTNLCAGESKDVPSGYSIVFWAPTYKVYAGIYKRILHRMAGTPLLLPLLSFTKRKYHIMIWCPKRCQECKMIEMCTYIWII